jgi:hypothetical protein
MRAADAIMAAIQQRHARRVGAKNYRQFKSMFVDITDHQRSYLRD